MPPPETPANGQWYPITGVSDSNLTTRVKNYVELSTANVSPSSGIQSCPLARPTPLKPVNETPCNFDSIKVSTPNRGFDLVVNPATPSNQRTLGIVSGFKKTKKVFFLLQNSVGPCPATHNSKRSFNTGSRTFKILPESSENKLALEVSSENRIQIFPWGLTTNKYSISANRCEHASESATVEVYPDTQTDIFIGFDFGEKKVTKDVNTEVEQKPGNRRHAANLENRGLVYQRTTTTTTETTEIAKGVKIGGSIKYDDIEFKIDVVFKKTIETIKKISRVIDRAKVTLAQLKGNQAAASAGAAFDSPVELGIKLPVVSLHVGGSWKEDAGLPTVRYNGKVKLAADPLFGLFFEWNITSTVLQSIPGGLVFQKIKKKLVDGFLELILKAGVEIGGEIELTIQNKEVTNVSGRINGKIPIAAELVVLKADVGLWITHATVEYKVGVESGYEIEIGYSTRAKVLNCIGGMLDMVIWWSSYHAFGAENTDTEPNKYAAQSRIGPEIKNELYKKDFGDKSEFFTYDFKKQ